MYNEGRTITWSRARPMGRTVQNEMTQYDSISPPPAIFITKSRFFFIIFQNKYKHCSYNLPIAIPLAGLYIGGFNDRITQLYAVRST